MIKKIVSIIVLVLLIASIAGNIYLLTNYTSKKNLEASQANVGAVEIDLKTCVSNSENKDKIIAQLQREKKACVQNTIKKK